MSDPIEIPLNDDSDHLVEPPIVDHLYLDEARGVYVVTFIPQDNVSAHEKETVQIESSHEDGRRIALRLQELGKLVEGKILRLYHSGGGDFGFKLDHNRNIALSQIHHPWTEAYVYLQDLGMIAQIAYRQMQLLNQGAA
jgi:hypothetical protein